MLKMGGRFPIDFYATWLHENEIEDFLSRDLRRHRNEISITQFQKLRHSLPDPQRIFSSC